MFLREFVFYVSTGYSFVRKYLAGHNWYTRITPKLILGALPLRSFWDELERTENVTHIVSMLEPFEVKSFVVGSEEAESRGLKHLSLPVRDFVGVPTVEQVEAGITFIDSCTDPNGTVYVHCKAGRTRSAFLLACYLMRRDRISAEHAVKLIKQKRPHIKFTTAQWSSLQDFSQMDSSQQEKPP